MEQHYAREILTGRLAPGARIPSNAELATIWKTSSRAVHAALGGLVIRGLVERKQRRGTFVTDHRRSAMIGVLVKGHLVNENAAYFRMLCYQLEVQLEKLRLSCRIYDDLGNSSQANEGESPSLRHFLLDQKVYDFKGFIYIGTATIDQLPAVNDLHPRVVHLDSTRGLDVVLDMDDFLRTTVSEMASRGFRKLAYVRPLWKNRFRTKPLSLDKALAEVAAECGIAAPRSWDLMLRDGETNMEHDAFEQIKKGLREGVLGKKSEFPDAIIIPDDVMARPLIFALRDMGIRVPADVNICILSNTEVDFFYGVPVYRYGISISDLAKHMISLLQIRMIRKDEPALPIKLKGQFLEIR